VKGGTLNEIVAAIYEVPFEGRYSRSLLRHLAGTLGSEISVVLEEAAPRGHARVFEKVGMTDTAIRAYEEYYAARSVLLRESARYAQVGQIFRDHMIPDYDEYLSSETYHDFFRPNKADHLMQVHIERTNEWVTALLVRRPARKGPYANSDKRKLTQLIPHLVNSARHFRIFRSESLIRDSAMQALDHLQAAVFLLDGRGQVVFANAAGEALLTAGDILTVRHRRLAAADPQDQSRLRSIIDDARTATDNAARPLRSCLATSGKSRRNAMTLHAMPVTRHAADKNLLGRASVMLVATGVNKVAAGDRLLRQLYGLTPAEAQITEALCTGSTVRQIAARRRTSENAVRFHLKNIFQKLGVRRQADLVKLVCSGPMAPIMRQKS